MAKQFFEDKRPHNGMTYNEYMEMFKNEIESTDIDKLDDKEKKLFDYKKLNYQRSSRIDKTYSVSTELSDIVKELNDKQLWMVLTEGWCGDSAQNLPYIAKIAGLNPNIDLRILLRDSNLDIMDEYQTKGTRSIPKIVAFDSEGNELFNWGPRPKEAQQLITQWKDEGVVKPELYEKLHLWYGRNRGKNIESEFLEILSRVEQMWE